MVGPNKSGNLLAGFRRTRIRWKRCGSAYYVGLQVTGGGGAKGSEEGRGRPQKKGRR